MNVKCINYKFVGSDFEFDDVEKYNVDKKVVEIVWKCVFKGKLKIKESGYGANKRVVFDEDGTFMALF